IETAVRTLGTDAFSAEVLSANEIAAFEAVASGSILSATWPLAEAGEQGWYVRASAPHGAVDRSPVQLFTVLAAPEPDPGEGGGGDADGGAGGGADGGGGGADGGTDGGGADGGGAADGGSGG